MENKIEIISNSVEYNPLCKNNGLLIKNVPTKILGRFLKYSVKEITTFLKNHDSPFSEFHVETKLSDNKKGTLYFHISKENVEIEDTILVQFIFHTTVGGMGATADVQRNKVHEFYSSREPLLKKIILQAFELASA